MRIFLLILALVCSAPAFAQLDLNVPLPTNAIDNTTQMASRVEQFSRSPGEDTHHPVNLNERQEEEENFNSNSNTDIYNRPSDREFNRNWDQESQSIQYPGL
jgi:hypothetical protein